MDYDERKIFMRGRALFIASSVIYTLLFLAAVFLQRFVFIDYARVILSIFLIIISFFMNLAFGIPGYWISTALTMLQTVTYISEFRYMYDENIMVLIGLCLLSLLVNTMFEFFITRVGDRIDLLGKRLSDEKARRISSENAALIEKTMAARPGTIVRHEDIADKSAYAEAVESSKTTTLDPLTTLPNRHMTSEYSDIRILEYKKDCQEASDSGDPADINPIYMIYLTVVDPVRFSQDNGHIIVDLFIQTMAHRLREAADSRDFVGRIANNEFAVITTRFRDDAQIIKYVSMLSAALMEENGGSFYAGIAQYPRDSIFAGELMQHSEAAMNRAVKTGKEIMVYEPTADESRKSFLEKMPIEQVKTLFDKAFEEDEIFMVYQPRFSAARKLTGFEAFIRWNCPGHGTVDTRDFLFYAEKTGHIYALGELSLKQSFETLAMINRIDPSLTMTVNLSSTQLHTTDLQIDLLDVAQEAGCSLRNLIIDIPSDGAMMNVSEIQNTLDALSSSGITMALDNFGRGYSSLSSIPLLPISLVKLDGHFTSDLREGSARDVLTRSIIALLGELDIPVDATNVGSKEQFEKLKEYGCTYFQGQYLSEPMTRDSLNDYITAAAARESAS